MIKAGMKNQIKKMQIILIVSLLTTVFFVKAFQMEIVPGTAIIIAAICTGLILTVIYNGYKRTKN